MLLISQYLIYEKSSPLGMSDLFSTWISIFELWIFESLELSADFHCSSKFENSNKVQIFRKDHKYLILIPILNFVLALLSRVSNVKRKWKIDSNFVDFLQHLNFTYIFFESTGYIIVVYSCFLVLASLPSGGCLLGSVMPSFWNQI